MKLMCIYIWWLDYPDTESDCFGYGKLIWFFLFMDRELKISYIFSQKQTGNSFETKKKPHYIEIIHIRAPQPRNDLEAIYIQRAGT